MEQQNGQFGRTGRIDLTVRPNPNASLVLSAVPLIDKKAFLAKFRASLKTGLNSMRFSVPGMESGGPARGPQEGPNSQKVAFARGL